MINTKPASVAERLAAADAIHEAAGLDMYNAHEPYIAAVVHELTLLGFDVGPWWINEEDADRTGVIDLGAMPEKKDPSLIWSGEHGWSLLSRPAVVSDWVDEEIPVGFLAQPYEVATALCAAVGHPVKPRTTTWEPPADYNYNPVRAERFFDASPDLERALTCYTTYPGWKA